VTTATVDDFDTLQFVKSMTGKGMPEGQAEELAGHIQKHQNRLVTRQYFREHLDKRFAETNTRMAEMEARLTARIMWVCGGMIAGGITVLGWMMQTMLGAGG